MIRGKCFQGSKDLQASIYTRLVTFLLMHRELRKIVSLFSASKEHKLIGLWVHYLAILVHFPPQIQGAATSNMATPDIALVKPLTNGKFLR